MGIVSALEKMVLLETMNCKFLIEYLLKNIIQDRNTNTLNFKVLLKVKIPAWAIYEGTEAFLL